MSDASEWRLQYQPDREGEPDWWVRTLIDEGDTVHMPRRFRWRHASGATQPARTDDEGRLLGPEPIAKRIGIQCHACERKYLVMSDDPHFECDCGRAIMVPSGTGIRIDRDGNALRDELDQQAQAIAERGGGLHELVGKWPGDEPVTGMENLPSLDPIGDIVSRHQELFRALCDVELAKLLCPCMMRDEATIDVTQHTDGMGRAQCYQMRRECDVCGDAEKRVYASDVDDLGAHGRNQVMAGVTKAREQIRDVLGDRIEEDVVERPSLKAGKVSMGVESTYGEARKGADVYLDECSVYGEIVDRESDDRHIRAQLADGLRGEWRPHAHETCAWVMYFGEDWIALIDVDEVEGVAHGAIHFNCDSEPYVDGTWVSARASDGDDYILRCAALLKPKVDAVRELVEELRDD